jgi:glycosyltransferase involved in cell wall biosynthesis
MDPVELHTPRVEGGLRLHDNVRPAPPLVSIITVVFRAARELPTLIESVAAQKGEDVEFIIIDGGSDDGTIALLRHFDDKIDYWISEPDGGIYDAMNKGLAAATGEFVLHLNAGDRLKFIPREELHRCLAKKVDAACFSVEMAGFGEHRPRSGFLLRIDNSLHHQGVFYRRVGHPGYNVQYRVYSDFDCNQKMLQAGRSIVLFRKVVAEQYEVGASAKGGCAEKLQIVRTNYGLRYAALAWLWYRFDTVTVQLKHLLTWLESRKK